MFEIYRSKQNPQHYVAIRADDVRDTATGIRESGNLTLMATIADDDAQWIAFDGGEATSRIDRDGFYAFAVTIQVREHAE